MGESEAVRDGGVARDAGGGAGGQAGRCAAHEGECAFMRVAQPGFEFEDFLATDREAAMSGLDDGGVDGADGDLMHSLAWAYVEFRPGGGAVRRAELLDGGARVRGAQSGVAVGVVGEALEPGCAGMGKGRVGAGLQWEHGQLAGLVEGVGVMGVRPEGDEFAGLGMPFLGAGAEDHCRPAAMPESRRTRNQGMTKAMPKVRARCKVMRFVPRPAFCGWVWAGAGAKTSGPILRMMAMAQSSSPRPSGRETS